MSLDDIRKKIDTLDSKLLELLNERADLVHEVGEIKKKDGIEIYAPEREESLLKSLVKKVRVALVKLLLGQYIVKLCLQHFLWRKT